jgi:hypothetical protein
MRASRTLGIIAGISAIGLATLFVAAPASAATLPAGQKITVAQGDFVEVGPDAVQLLNANPADASLTVVGPPTGATAINIDVNDDGLGYGTGSQLVGDDDYPTPVLFKVDANTGVISDPVFIVPTDEELVINVCNGIALLPNGEILVACIDLRDGILNSVIGVVTPAGAFTAFYNSDANDDDEQNFSALAYNAVSGELWAFAFPDGPAAFLVDRAAGELGDPVYLELPVYGADFDRGGQLWATTDETGEGPVPSILATLDLALGDVIPVNPFTLGGVEQFEVAGITIWGKLAATGSTNGAETAPVAIGSALLLLAGAAFIATARLSRKRA